MSGRLRNWFRFPRRHPGWSLWAVLLLGLTGHLIWHGARALWFRRELDQAERALAEYDFVAARQRLAQWIRLKPRDPLARLLAAQAARRDGDLKAAEEQLDICRDLAGDSTPQEAL